MRLGVNRGVQEFGVKGHLGSFGVIVQICLKKLHLHDSIDFDETWVKRSLVRDSFGYSEIFDQRSSWGHLGSLLKIKF